MSYQRLLLLALAQMCAAGALISPPIISLSLSEEAAQDVHVAHADSKGVPCHSPGANAAECANPSRQVYYKFCHVQKDTAETCDLPTASAHDHHEGALQVTQTFFLHVRSDPHTAPVVVDVRAPGNRIDFGQRGEYYINYDAQDSSGNKATTVSFHVFMVDHDPPTIAVVTDPFDAAARHVSLPVTALDAYDGDVTDVTQVHLTAPGQSAAQTVHGAIDIDTQVEGTWTVRVGARDFASAFGRDYKNNEAHKDGHVVVTGGRVTQVKVGEQVTDIAAPPAPAPAPAPAEAPAPAPETQKKGHYVPPVLMLSWGGNIVARGSPWGIHHTQKAYRAHLATKGVEQSEIEDHVAIIIAREERLAASLGAAAAWKGGDLF